MRQWSNLSQKDKFNLGIKYKNSAEPGETELLVKIKVDKNRKLEMIKSSKRKAREIFGRDNLW